LITGLPTSLEMAVAFVGLGFAAWTQPYEAQLPQAMMAAASLAVFLRISSALSPAMQQ